ncbi:hypothetical protein OROGR_032842 [Orobanche gracilis]
MWRRSLHDLGRTWRNYQKDMWCRSLHGLGRTWRMDFQPLRYLPLRLQVQTFIFLPSARRSRRSPTVFFCSCSPFSVYLLRFLSDFRPPVGTGHLTRTAVFTVEEVAGDSLLCSDEV